MRILIFDEDKEQGIKQKVENRQLLNLLKRFAPTGEVGDIVLQGQVRQVIDVLKQNGHDVVQVTDYKDLKQQIEKFKPEGIVIDLMMPIPELPQVECRGGYTSGAYIYKTIIHESAKGIPFIVYSAVDPEVTYIRETTEALRTFTEYRGFLAKGCEVKLIVEKLSSHS